MTDTSDPRSTDRQALLDYLEHRIQCDLDELADIGGCDVMQRLAQYIADHIPLSSRPRVEVIMEKFDAMIMELVA
jgi:hypothetical protein